MSVLSHVLAPFARRFVAGTKAEDAIAAARKINGFGAEAILDYLGEDVATVSEAHAATTEYLRLLELIRQGGVRASVSLKVSQMGLLLSPGLCNENVRTILERAARQRTLVWFDMEGSALTQKTIETFDGLRVEFPLVGLCVQASLRRTSKDLNDLMSKPLRFRLCKGAYKEYAAVAYLSKGDVDKNFRTLAQQGLAQRATGAYPAFATHDRTLIEKVLALVAQGEVPKSDFEFQMLYGIGNRYLEQLIRQGYRGAVYVPYGNAWLPYFLRRLRERRENTLFVVKNLFRA